MPNILGDDYKTQIRIIKNNDSGQVIKINDEIEYMEDELQELYNESKIINEDVSILQEQVNNIRGEVAIIEKVLTDRRNELLLEETNIKSIEDNICILNKDIINNQDAQKLKRLGAELSLDFTNDICPICRQKIQDSLMFDTVEARFMSIDENINHLKEQKNMLEITKKLRSEHCLCIKMI